jgi:hypothetical protein
MKNNRYIKTFESFEYLQKDKDPGSDKTYNVTIDKILAWKFGKEWSDYSNWDNVTNYMLIDEEYISDLDRGESIVILDTLNKNKDEHIEVDASDNNYSIDISFIFNGAEYSFDSPDYPFTNSEEMSDIERSLTLKISEELEGDDIMIDANIVDIAMYIEEMIKKSVDFSDITSEGFKRWFNLLKYGNN